MKARVEFLDARPAGGKLGDRYRVEARIVIWRGYDALQIPTGALFRRGNDWMVFAVQDGKARLQKLEIAHNNGVTAEVTSGLKEGDTIILYPPDTVADGSKVAPAP